jgi:nitrate reductase delta subunit
MRMKRKTNTLAALGWLVTYPDENLRAALPEIEAVLQTEKWLPEKSLTGVRKLTAELQTRDLLDVQEEYVNLFDRTPSLSLHLFEHVHGDSRERGPAMVDLDRIYREAGLDNASDETPDYLPLFLEYLSILEPEKAREDLKGAVDVIAALGERLKKRGSLYAHVFEGLIAASKQAPDMKNLQRAMEIDAGALPSAEALDEVWEAQFAFDNPMGKQSDGCPKAKDMLARIGIESIKTEKRP